MDADTAEAVSDKSSGKIRYHYVREAVNEGTINVIYCPTNLMVADCLTKALVKEKFEELRAKLGLRKIF